MTTSIKTIIEGAAPHIQRELRSFTNAVACNPRTSFLREATGRLIGYIEACHASGSLLEEHKDVLVDAALSNIGRKEIAACFTKLPSRRASLSTCSGKPIAATPANEAGYWDNLCKRVDAQ